MGYDLNARFLDKLVRENFGQSEYVRPDENIEEHVARLYNRIESPVLTGLQMRYDFDSVKTEDGPPVNRIYPHDAADLFAGDQLVVVGRYKKSGTAKIVATGKIGDKEERFDFPATFVEQSSDESLAFVEKLWAVRRVGEILDQIDLNGKNSELVKELVELATRHGILTPYTSFMADETTNIHDITSNTQKADRRLESLSQTGGAAGTAQRAMKNDFQNAYNFQAANDIRANRPKPARQKTHPTALAVSISQRLRGWQQGGPGGRAAWVAWVAAASAGPLVHLPRWRCQPSKRPTLPKRPRPRANCPTAARSRRRPTRPRSRSATSAIAPSIDARTSGSIPRSRPPSSRTPARSSSSARSISTWPTATATRCRSTWPWMKPWS